MLSDVAKLERRLYEAKKMIDAASESTHNSVVETSGRVYQNFSDALLRLQQAIEVTEQRVTNSRNNIGDAVGDLRAGLDLAMSDLKTAVESAGNRISEGKPTH